MRWWHGVTHFPQHVKMFDGLDCAPSSTSATHRSDFQKIKMKTTLGSSGAKTKPYHDKIIFFNFL